MYKILILYNADHNLWKQYGTTATSSVPGGKSTFTEFETDNVEILKTELLKLDRVHGFENIKVYQDVTANYSVDIVMDEVAKDKDNNVEVDADKKPDLEI